MRSYMLVVRVVVLRYTVAFWGTLMVHTPEPSEAEALDRSGGLLRYAAENKQLDQTIISPICAAWDAKQGNAWDQITAVNFWLAFNSLCSLIKPVTMDSLSTNLREITPPKWAFWTKKPISLSKRTANRYLVLLITLLVVAVVFAFVLSRASELGKDIKDLLDSSDQLTTKIASSIDTLTKNGIGDFSKIEDKDKQIVATVQDQFQQLNYLQELVLQKRQIMSFIISFGWKFSSYHPGTNEPAKNVSELNDALLNYKKIRRVSNSYLFTEAVVANIISSSILPIVLGLMGACAYVVRLISDQIKDTTFSTTSLIRHRVRLILGALAGVVIGFGGIAPTGGLSPSALAFIAGYSIEPVFATLDSIAEKFRR